MKEEKVLVAITVWECSVTDVVFAINSVIGQSYKNISLLIMGCMNGDMKIEPILETVNFIERDNIQDVSIYFPMKYVELRELKEYAVSYAINNRCSYVTTLLDGDCFYDGNSLEKMMKFVNINDDVVCANVVLYDKDNNYCGEYIAVESGEMSWSQIEVDSKINKYFSNMLIRAKSLKKEKMYISSISDINYIRHQEKKKNRIEEETLTGHKENMSYTQLGFLNRCVSIMRWRKLSEEERQKISEIIKEFKYKVERGRVQGEGDQYFIQCLEELQRINNNKGRFWYLRKYKFKQKRIKVVFFTQTYATWTSLKSVYEEMINDDRFSVKLVYVEGHHQNAETKKIDEGISDYGDLDILSQNQYFLEEERPDLAFFVVPYSFVDERYTIDAVSKMVPRCIYIPYGFTLESALPELVRLRYKIAMQFLAWKVVCGDEFGIELGRRYAWSKGKNFVAWGNPRIDLLQNLASEIDSNYVNDLRRKAGNRTMILWNTHHSIDADNKMFSSWAKFGDKLIKVWNERKDIFVIWRPHPLFWEALKKYLGESVYLSFKDQISKMENLFIDEHSSYLHAFCVADIFISDASSLIKEFLYIGKPIILTTGNKEQIINPQVLRCLYIPEDEEQLENCIDRLMSGQDEKKQLRNEYIMKNGNTKKKTVGKNITQNIYRELNNEIKKLIY